MHIPVNRWTVMLLGALAMIFGNNIVDPVLKVIGILTANHVPAY